MNSEKLDLICEQVAVNILKEATTTGDMATFAPLIVPLLKKLYTEALITQIADVQPLTSSVGKVAALFTTYGGNGNSAETNTHPDNSYLIVVASTAGFTVDTTPYTFSADGSSTFKVRYKEGTKLLISRETGTYVPTATGTFGGQAVSYVTLNRASIKKMFKSYSGSYAMTLNDANTNVKSLGVEVRTIDTTTVARKLKSKFSQEQLQDMLTIFNEKGIDVFSTAVAHEIRQEIDKEFITYIKFIAKDIINGSTAGSVKVLLTDSYGASPSGSLQDVSYDLVSNIYLAAEEIVHDTKRNRTIFVLADPITTAFLQTNAFHVKADPNEKNPYKVGSIGVYPLFTDLYAESNETYIIVGYLGVDGEGDAGVIYSPYTTSTHAVTDANTFTENVLYMERYAMTRHPQDTGNVTPASPYDATNADNSDFFKFFAVDFSGLKNFGDKSLQKFV